MRKCADVRRGHELHELRELHEENKGTRIVMIMMMAADAVNVPRFSFLVVARFYSLLIIHKPL